MFENAPVITPKLVYCFPVDALPKTTHNTEDKLKSLTPLDEKPLSWQLPLQLQYRAGKSWKESYGWTSLRNTLGEKGNGAPCTDDAGFDQGSRGRGAAAFSPRDDNRGDVHCDGKVALPEETALKMTCKSGYGDRHGPHSGSKPSDSLSIDEPIVAISTRSIAADFAKEELSKSVKTDRVTSFAQGVDFPGWKVERSEIKTSWETMTAKKDADKVVNIEATVNNGDMGKPLKKRRLKVQELPAGEAFTEHTATAKKKRRSKSEAILKAQPESEDLSRGTSPTGGTPPHVQGVVQSSAEFNDTLSGGGGLAGVRKSQRSNRGKKYQELIMQGLIQPSRNCNRKQEAR